MLTKCAENTGPKQAAGRPFQPGQSGNPNGRPVGARNRSTCAVETLLDGEAEKLTRKAVELALSGDTIALRLCLDRVAPVRKGRTISIATPRLHSPSDLPAAQTAIANAMLDGLISPAEADSATQVLERMAAAYERREFEQRILALEAKARNSE